jgi:uroporphyrinogen-III decarboxylase
MKTDTMTSKERILCAMRGGTPDRVPVQLGIYSIATIFSKSTFWDVYYHNKFDLAELMVEMAREFDFDGYLYTGIGAKRKNEVNRTTNEVVSQDEEFIVRRTTIETPGGTLWSERTFPRTEVPTTTRGLVKTVEDFKLYLEYCLPDPDELEWDATPIERAKKLLGDHGAVGATQGTLPGLHDLISVFDGKLETATYFMVDHPELMEEYRQRKENILLSQLPRMLEARPDYVEISNSGMLTLSNPEWVRQFALPTLKKATRLCRQAGIPSELHCCGKARLVVEMCANETELDSINPLQPPPMGDCDLAEIKCVFGKRLCIKGNVGVTDPMLTGTPDDVEKDVIRCLNAAKAGGGYILFTEEGLGANTPFANIRRYVQVGKALGGY